ncbi:MULTISPECIES: arginine--tRNA ligase [unclassified Fusibacter]|uniref:arginine--tRNA ligase n=1 Tax=unclassified Fusibacter TaxID=2624464 RepID=UPI001010DEF2|nr:MULTISPECIES: arginine--tRNA ligase [unclassified Fusibacter]MCK8058715.1 arginine--tRNA ligase [Fusibacter sp. A2]NPE21789.1 arginine--tRNA ligase [Fusibacter sp. A1]RXV61362.1 arginine--tRNA ligase [Fusibacter sp. A1]
MLSFKHEIANKLATVITDLTVEELVDTLEIPKHDDMGDYAFPCFKLSKIFRKAPPMIATELAGQLNDELFESVAPAGGYINFKISPAIYAKVVLEAVENQGENYGHSTMGEGKKVIVEYSSINIAKPFHMGHIRSTMIGHSLNRIYKALGFDTVSINHLGDYGTQFGKLIVAYKLWGDKDAIEADPIPELLKIYIRFHDEAESKPEMDDEARAWFTKLENKDEEAVALWTWFREVSLKEFMRVYKMLGVEFDSLAGESFYSDKMDEVLDILRSNKVLKKSDGAEIVDLEPYGMPPALITKKDGSTLYMTRDLAAAIYRKRTYDFYKNIYVVAYQQDLHFKQWFKVLELMKQDYAKDCIHVNFGMVSLEEGTLSTRKGRVVFLEDVLKKATQMALEVIDEKNPTLDNKEEVAKEIGIGAVVFQELFNNRIKDYTFSWSKAMAFEGETGPYVQYAHARANTLIEKAGTVDASKPVDYSLLSDEASNALIRSLYQFPQSVIDAMEANEPSRVTRYVVGLAQDFNKFYQVNHINVEDEALKLARLSLVKATKQTIKNALYLIGISAPEKM